MTLVREWLVSSTLTSPQHLIAKVIISGLNWGVKEEEVIEKEYQVVNFRGFKIWWIFGEEKRTLEREGEREGGRERGGEREGGEGEGEKGGEGETVNYM